MRRRSVQLPAPYSCCSVQLPAIEPVEVLVHHHLKAGGIALLADELRPGEEELPDTEPALAVLRPDVGATALPVGPPGAQRLAVVAADVFDAVDLPARLLGDLQHRRQRQRRVG